MVSWPSKAVSSYVDIYSILFWPRTDKSDILSVYLFHACITWCWQKKKQPTIHWRSPVYDMRGFWLQKPYIAGRVNTNLLLFLLVVNIIEYMCLVSGSERSHSTFLSKYILLYVLRPPRDTILSIPFLFGFLCNRGIH